MAPVFNNNQLMTRRHYEDVSNCAVETVPISSRIQDKECKSFHFELDLFNPLKTLLLIIYIHTYICTSISIKDGHEIA